MAERKPATLYGPPGADPLGRARNRDFQLDRFPLLQGRWVTGMFAAGSTLLRTNHKLGRPYIGAVSFMYTESTGLNADGLIVIAPERAIENGLTPDTEVYLRRATTVNDLALRFWVF